MCSFDVSVHGAHNHRLGWPHPSSAIRGGLVLMCFAWFRIDILSLRMPRASRAIGGRVRVAYRW